MNLLSSANIGLLIVGTITSVIGFAAFRHGKNNGSMRFIVYGVVLLIYPYMIYTLSYSIVAGVCLTLLMLFGERFGI